MGGRGVTQGVDGGIFGNPALAHHRCERLLEGGGGQGRRAMPGGEHPGAGPLALPVLPPSLEHPGGQRHVAVFATFALSDSDQQAVGVDVRDLQLRPFPQAQPTGIDHSPTHPGFRFVDSGQQVPDLRRTPYHRQLLALPRSNEVEDRPRSLQGKLIDEPDPLEVHTEGALGNLLLIQQEQAGLAELRFADLIGSTSVVLCQLVDGGDITRLGLGGQAPELQVFQHTASKGSHGHPPVRGEHQRSPMVDTNQEDIWQRSVREERTAGGTSAGPTRELPRSGFVQRPLDCRIDS
jgi:hypothetical protein